MFICKIDGCWDSARSVQKALDTCFFCRCWVTFHTSKLRNHINLMRTILTHMRNCVSSSVSLDGLSMAWLDLERVPRASLTPLSVVTSVRSLEKCRCRPIRDTKDGWRRTTRENIMYSALFFVARRREKRTLSSSSSRSHIHSTAESSARLERVIFLYNEWKLGKKFLWVAES